MPREDQAVKYSVHGKAWIRVARGELTSADLDSSGRVIAGPVLPAVPLPYQLQDTPPVLPPPVLPPPPPRAASRQPLRNMDINVLTIELRQLERENSQLIKQNRMQEKLITALCNQYATNARAARN